MISKEVSGRIIDDAREKIKDMVRVGCLQIENRGKPIGELILAISGTTDIECPECEGRGKDYRDGGFDGEFANCPKCDNGVIKHKWKVEDFAKYRQVVE